MMGRIYGRCKIRIQDHSNNVIMHMNESQKKKKKFQENLTLNQLFTLF